MKVGIFSDTHLGFDEKGERAGESFDNLEQAIRLCIDSGVDLMVLSGDVFDAPVPSHNTLFHAVRSFSAARSARPSVRLFLEKDGKRGEITCSGVPILAIHGNHEFLGKDTRTALDVLNLAGLSVYFHAAKVIAEKGSEKVAVHGLGAVPEKKALAVLQQWAPSPVPGVANIMLLHQSFKEFMAIDDEMAATLSLDDLPKGFDVIVDGHLHWRNTQELSPLRSGQAKTGGERRTIFLLAGSTIATAIKKLECETPKGVHIFDTDSGRISFSPLPRQRAMFYYQVNLKEADAETALRECRAAVSASIESAAQRSNAAAAGLKPLVRVNLKGTVKKGLAPSDINLGPVFEEFSQKAILSVSKNFSALDFKRKIADLREMQKSRLSLAQVGFGMLEKNLKETDFGSEVPAKDLFELLSSEEFDKAMSIVTGPWQP